LLTSCQFVKVIYNEPAGHEINLQYQIKKN
jgi:hypothetical protein